MAGSSLGVRDLTRRRDVWLDVSPFVVHLTKPRESLVARDVFFKILTEQQSESTVGINTYRDGL